MKTSSAWIACLLALVAATSSVGLGKQRAARQAAALDQARQQTLRLRRLQEENRRLTGGQLSPEDRTRLEREHAEMEALRERVVSLQRELDEDDTRKEDGPFPATEWAYAGRATPKASFESVLWAAAHGEIDRLASLLDLDGDARASVDALFGRLPPASQQEYGSPQRVVATLVAGNFPKDASAMTLLRAEKSGQAAQLAVRLDHADGTSRTHIYQFRQAADGWQLVVPPGVLAGYEKALQGGP
jgi:hypothetical protein